MGKVVFIGNYKGGVGKTTTVVNFADSLSKKGKKILTIDLDPQSSLSEIQVTNFLSKTLAKLDDDEVLNHFFDLYVTKIKKYPSLIIPFSEKIIHKKDDFYSFIPSSLFYKKGLGLDALAMKMLPNLEYLSILENLLSKIKDGYDYILIDCPPSNNVITQSAFLSSDYYLIPSILDHLSTNGVVHYIKVIEKIYSDYCENDKNEESALAKALFGKKPELVGIFYNLIRGTVSYETEKTQFLGELKKSFGNNSPYIFESQINNFVDIARETANGNLFNYRKDFEPVVEEFLKRIGE